jgi:PAS domain-containing protein
MGSQENKEQQAQYLRAIFDAIPQPAFVMDHDMRIHDFNTAAEGYLGPEPAAALRLRGGEALQCLHAEPAGCGQAEGCKDCLIRQSVLKALAGRTTSRQMHVAQLRASTGSILVDLLVTATLLPYTEQPRALLILENVTEILQLSRKRKAKQRHAAPGNQSPSAQSGLAR